MEDQHGLYAAVREEELAVELGQSVAVTSDAVSVRRLVRRRALTVMAAAASSSEGSRIGAHGMPPPAAAARRSLFGCTRSVRVFTRASGVAPATTVSVRPA